MRILFLSRPDTGHRYPTLRLAEELGARGHRVTFAAEDHGPRAAEAAGVRVLRLGRRERRLLDTPGITSFDAVVADPRTAPAATGMAGEWGVPVVVAGQNLAASAHGWPCEHAHENYVFTLPGATGAVRHPWRRHGDRPVLLVDGPSIGPLARAFGDTAWQVVVSDTGPGEADVFLTDGRLASVSAGLLAGVPMVLAPRTAEDLTRAGQVVALGVGTALASLAETRAEDLRRTVEHLRVDEPTLAAARRHRELVAVAGAPERAADRVEALLTAPPLTRAA